MSEECTSSKKIENLVINILYSSFIFIIIFLFFSLLMMYEVISEKEGAISLSSLISIVSSFGVFATIWVYRKQKNESDIKNEQLMKIKEKSIKKLYKQELDKTIDIHNEFKSILEYLKNDTGKNAGAVVTYDIPSCYCINFIREDKNNKLIIVQKRSGEILNGILLSSTDINESLYEDIFSCLNALVSIGYVMSSFFSMATIISQNTNDDNTDNKAICHTEFLKQFFLGEGTSDNSSQLEVLHNGDELKKIALRYK